jgi:hypothetical protein
MLSSLVANASVLLGADNVLLGAGKGPGIGPAQGGLCLKA